MKKFDTVQKLVTVQMFFYFETDEIHLDPNTAFNKTKSNRINNEKNKKPTRKQKR